MFLLHHSWCTREHAVRLMMDYKKSKKNNTVIIGQKEQGQRSQSARGFCPRSTMRVPQPDIIEHIGNADAVPQPSERCLSRQAGIVRCCLITKDFVYSSIPASGSSSSNRRRPAVEVTGKERMTERALLAVPA